MRKTGYDLTTKARVLEMSDKTHYPVVYTGGYINGGADAFGRGRLSYPTNVFSSSFEYDLQPLIFEVVTVTGGSVVHGNSDTPVSKTCAVMKTDGQANASAIMTQIGVNHYQPGKSQSILETFVLGAKVTNVRKRIGYFDASDGVFLQQDANGEYLVMRSSVSNSVVDTKIHRTTASLSTDGVSTWSDKLNGTGESGITIDWATQQIFNISLQWLGAGSISFGFDIAGMHTHVLRIDNSNQNALAPYMRCANLPIRAEITSTSASSAAQIKFICSAVDSEGGLVEETGYNFSVSNGITPITVTTRRPILSIRPATTFNSISNTIRLRLTELELICKTNDGYWELVYGGTLGGSPSWGAASGSSGVEFDIAANSISNGIIVHTGYIVAGAGSARASISQDIDVKFPFAMSNAGVQKTYSLVITSFTGNCVVNGSICWKEIR